MTILICVLILIMYEFEKRRLFRDEDSDRGDLSAKESFDCQEHHRYVSDDTEVSEIWKVLFLGFVICSFVLYFS